MTEPWRGVASILKGQETSDGAGVRLKRSLGTPSLSYLDPFLLLDEFKSDDAADYIAGFPDHPHRGFETVTYMIAGYMQHGDHKGQTGNLEPGSVQWMTAGRGIIHSEMPRQKDGLLWGFQLWVNLPARDKMCEPRYQDIPPAEVPEVEQRGGVRVRVIAGASGTVRGAVSGIATDPLYLDVHMPPETRFEQTVSRGHNAFCYGYEGRCELAPRDSGEGRSLSSGELAVLSDGDRLAVVTADSAARFLLIAARPLHEPVARAGPFVMNSRDELQKAFQDLSDGTFLD